MDELIVEQLAQEEMTPFHKALLHHCLNLVQISSRHMSHYYESWDAAADTYNCIRRTDKQDEAAEKRGEPIKMVVPLTYAQVETYIAFCMSLFTQRPRLFELIPMDEQADKSAKAAEAILARDLTKNVFEARLYQWLLDIARFGVGIFKTAWVEETAEEEVTETTPMLNFFGLASIGSRTSTSMQRVIKYQGNRIANVSPYRFFPDTRLPLSRFQEGEFCASEDDYSLTEIRRMEKNGEFSGTQWVKSYDYKRQKNKRRTSMDAPPIENTKLSTHDQSLGMAVLTEVQVKLIPNQFLIDDVPMGEEDYPVQYIVVIANDERVIKCEPSGYKHDEFTYDLAEFRPDMHKDVVEGLAAPIDQLQAVISWLINSHITSVRKVIQNSLVTDPSGIEMKDLAERRPVIRLKSERAGQGVDKFIKQLDVHDVTAKHVDDATTLHGFLQVASGISENALGQYHAGRRSATESRNVNSAAASRLKLSATLLFRTGLEPMGRKLLSNLQDGLSQETYVRVLGQTADPQAYLQLRKVSKADLTGNFDFEIFDGTLPSERVLQAQALEEFLTNIAQNPQIVPVLGFDPIKIVLEWLELRGIRNPKRFLLDQIQAQLLLQQMDSLGMIQNGEPGLSQNGQPGTSASGGSVPGQSSASSGKSGA